jgi:hypothetical protein
MAHFDLFRQFVGLILDSKLSWEAHLRRLLVKCEQSMNVLKVLSGRSWGRDQTVILQLYQLLLCSKGDYGSFVYGFATKSKLSIINPIHNTGIHLATGAYCTNHLGSLYIRCGESPLDLQRNLLLYVYLLKLAAQPPPPPLTW